MATVIEIGLLALGFVFGVWWFSVFVLPVAYGLPRAVWWCVRGRAGWRAPFLYLAAPVIWSVILLGISLVLVTFFRPTANYLVSSGGLAVGQMLGVGVCAVRALFSRSTRRDMDADFQDFMRPHLSVAELSAQKTLKLADVLHDFGAVMERIDPLTYYDASTLPHTKDVILEILLLEIGSIEGQQLRDSLEVALKVLAQFQDGVGPTPISHMPVNLGDLHRREQAEQVSAQEVAAEVAAASVDGQKLKHLEATYRDEVQRFLAMARAAEAH